SCVTHSEYSLPRRVNHCPNNPSATYLYHLVRQFPHQGRVADEDHLIERAQVHRPAQHADILLGVGGVESPNRLVPKQGLVPDALPLLHVVDGDAQVHGFVHQHELLCSSSRVALTISSKFAFGPSVPEQTAAAWWMISTS